MKRQVAKLLGILSLLFVSVALFAQTGQRTVSGTVTNEEGEPMANVSVSLKGGTITSVTNASGVYTIHVPDVKPAVLVFTAVGIKTKEITLGRSDAINVVLEAEAYSLDEVVVIGYGTAKKKDLTGAVSTVEGDVIAKRNVTQLS